MKLPNKPKPIPIGTLCLITGCFSDNHGMLLGRPCTVVGYPKPGEVFVNPAGAMGEVPSIDHTVDIPGEVGPLGHTRWGLRWSDLTPINGEEMKDSSLERESLKTDEMYAGASESEARDALASVKVLDKYGTVECPG